MNIIVPCTYVYIVRTFPRTMRNTPNYTIYSAILYSYMYNKMDWFGTVLDPLCLQIEWMTFVQILRLFEISNSN